MRILSCLALLSLACSLACACSETSGGRLRVVTYNAGLAPGFIEHSEERAAPTLQAISRINADAICLQELWRPEDLARLTELTHDTMPHVASFMPMQEVLDTACSDAEVMPLSTCLAATCPDVAPDDLDDCVINECNAEFTALGQACRECLIGQLGNTLEDATNHCVGGTAGKWLFDGSFGLALLTRQEVLAENSLVLESNSLRRGVLHAHVNDPDAGEYHLFCTHLTAIFSNIPFPGAEGSWQEEQAAQIDAMLAWIQETAGDDAVILLGDMNTGPAVPAAMVTAETPENYAKFPAAGFAAPYVDSDDVACTFCPDNGLRQNETGASSGLIDHVFYRGFEADTKALRVLDTPVTVNVGEATITTGYSDHYGVLVTLHRR